MNKAYICNTYVHMYSYAAELWAVVNNAGVYGHGDVELCPIETYRRLADVNLYGMIRLTQELLPLVRQAKGKFEYTFKPANS